MIPRAIANALDKCRTAPGLFVQEQPGLLVVGARFSDEQLHAWAAIAVDARDSWCRVLLVDSIGNEGPLDAADWRAMVGEEVKIIVRYSVPIGATHVFGVQGLNRILESADALSGISVVRVADSFEPFETRGPRFEPWESEPTAAPVRKPPAADRRPRRYVRSALEISQIPLEAEPWLLARDDVSNSGVLSIWKEYARRWMALSLIDELYADEGVTIAVLHGPPTRRLVLGRAGPLKADQFDAISAAAQWIFGEGHDVETKRTLLTNEIARLWGTSETYFDDIFSVVSLALEGARTAFAAHLKAGSRETIRTLAELRRGLADEAQRITQQTRDLATSLWRDIAIAIGAAAFRAVLDLAKSSISTNTTSISSVAAEQLYAGILVATIIYLLASIAVTTWINDRFLVIGRRTRDVWRRTLYGFLPDEDFRSLVQGPLAATTRTYDWALRVSWVVTVLACGILEVLALKAGQAP